MTGTTTTARSRDFQERAARVFGGGTLSIWTLPDDVPITLSRGQGAHVWDVDGREFVDYLMGSGPMLLGHCHPGVMAAVQAQLARGSHFHLNNEPAVVFAERVVAAVPCAEAIKFTSSGTEATFYALRAGASSHRPAAGLEVRGRPARRSRLRGPEHGTASVKSVPARGTRFGRYPGRGERERADRRVQRPRPARSGSWSGTAQI